MSLVFQVEGVARVRGSKSISFTSTDAPEAVSLGFSPIAAHIIGVALLGGQLVLLVEVDST